MHRGDPCPDGTPGFPNGTTNGAKWYPLVGGMQDYNYIWGNCVEITLELSCCKYPFAHELSNYWMQNKKSLLVYIAQVHRGVRGLIMDTNGNLVSRASLKIQGRDVTFKSSKRGEYWRLLLPGTYTLGKRNAKSCTNFTFISNDRLCLTEVTADGYHPAEKTFTVNEGVITNLSIQLIPKGFVSNSGVVSGGGPNNDAVHLNVVNAGPVHNQSMSPISLPFLNNTVFNNETFVTDLPFFLSVRETSLTCRAEKHGLTSLLFSSWSFSWIFFTLFLCQ